MRSTARSPAEVRARGAPTPRQASSALMIDRRATPPHPQRASICYTSCWPSCDTKAVVLRCFTLFGSWGAESAPLMWGGLIECKKRNGTCGWLVVCDCASLIEGTVYHKPPDMFFLGEECSGRWYKSQVQQTEDLSHPRDRQKDIQQNMDCSILVWQNFRDSNSQ